MLSVTVPASDYTCVFLCIQFIFKLLLIFYIYISHSQLSFVQANNFNIPNIMFEHQMPSNKITIGFNFTFTIILCTTNKLQSLKNDSAMKIIINNTRIRIRVHVNSSNNTVVYCTLSINTCIICIILTYPKGKKI